MKVPMTLGELGGWVVEDECVLLYCICRPNAEQERAPLGLGPGDEDPEDAVAKCRYCGKTYRFEYTITVEEP